MNNTFTVFMSPSGVSYIYKDGKEYCAFHHVWHGVGEARKEAEMVCNFLNSLQDKQ